MLIEDATAPKGQRAKVFDSGIAKSISELGQRPSAASRPRRTPSSAPLRYMSPNSAVGRDEDRRSIGCVFPGDHALRDGGWRTPPFDGSALGISLPSTSWTHRPTCATQRRRLPRGSRDADPAYAGKEAAGPAHDAAGGAGHEGHPRRAAHAAKPDSSAPTRMVGVVRRPKTMKVRDLAHPLALPLMLLLGVVFVGVAAIAATGASQQPVGPLPRCRPPVRWLPPSVRPSRWWQPPPPVALT